MNWLRNFLCKHFGIWCSHSEPMPETLPPCKAGLEFGYYGGGGFDHSTVAHIGSWGDWSEEGRAALIDTIVAQGHDAIAHGVTKLIFTLDFCLFTQTNPRQVLVPSVSIQYLSEFFKRLQDEGLWQYVYAWYPVDEPNIPEIDLDPDELYVVTSRIRALDPDRPLLCIFGWVNGRFPGIESFDWVGFDNYGAPIFDNGMYDALLDSLHPKQKTILVPGGASPWREAPYRFYKEAQRPEVALIMPFIWVTPDGIEVNGMAPEYRKVGLAVRGAV